LGPSRHGRRDRPPGCEPEGRVALTTRREPGNSPRAMAADSDHPHDSCAVGGEREHLGPRRPDYIDWRRVLAVLLLFPARAGEEDHRVLIPTSVVGLRTPRCGGRPRRVGCPTNTVWCHGPDSRSPLLQRLIGSRHMRPI